MANTVPPIPPGAAPAPPPPYPQKKKSIWPWLLLGCGGIIVIVIIVIVIIFAVVAKKASDVVGDMSKNPVMTAAKIAAMANPDVEVVSSDDEHNTITLRNKKTGETITINAEDVSKGKIAFKNEKGESVTIDSKGGESGSVHVKTDKGEMTWGAGGQIPDWVPVYHGATPKATFSAKETNKTMGQYQFETNDSSQDVIQFYESQLTGQGYEIEANATFGTQHTISAKNAAEGKTVVVVATVADGKTTVIVNFTLDKSSD